MWNPLPDDEYLKRVASWPKKYRREFLAVHNNLDTLMAALDGGRNQNTRDLALSILSRAASWL